MNIQEYIESGIIETYVMGAASEEESRELLAMAEKHPEVRKELEAVEAAMGSYAMQHSKTPPAHLKEKILSSLTGQSGARNNVTQPLTATKSASPSIARYLRPMAVAASLFLVASAILNIYLYNKLNKAENELVGVQTRNQLLTEQNTIQKAGYDIVMRDMNVMKNPSTKMVLMTDSSQNMKAMVFWVKETNETYVSIENMPELPSGKQFQLWAFVEGKPVDMGLFDMKKGSLIKLNTTDAADKFAVTLEDAGNGPVPHGPVVVIGSI